MANSEQGNRNFVNAAQGIVGALVLAVLMWVGNSIQRQSVTVVKIESEVALVKQTVSSLESRLDDAMSNRYTAGDAAEDQRYMNLQQNFLDDKHNKEWHLRFQDQCPFVSKATLY